MSPVDWFYSKGDEEHGPITSSELKSLADRGVLNPDDLLWRDGMDDWMPAGKVMGLFDGDLGLKLIFGAGSSSPAAPTVPTGPAGMAGSPPLATPPGMGSSPASQPATAPSAAPVVPVSPGTGSSKEPVSAGKAAAPVAAASPVTPSPAASSAPAPTTPAASSVVMVNQPAKAPRDTPSVVQEPQASETPALKGVLPHPIDLVLGLARQRASRSFVNLSVRMFTSLGHWGILVAMLMLVAGHVLLGMRSEHWDAMAWGMFWFAAILPLQYAAYRFITALERLNRTCVGRIASTAPMDCFAVLVLVAGLAELIGVTILASRTSEFGNIVPAILVFMFCQGATVLALNPESLGLTVVEDVDLGSEAIGVLWFLPKLLLRLTSMAMGVGVLWTIWNLGCDLVALSGETVQELTARAGRDVMEQISPLSCKLLLGCLLLPVVVYLGFLAYSLMVDVLLAILTMATRLDRLAARDEKRDR